MRALILALLLAACASASEPQGLPGNANDVVAAERAFAARGAEIGWVAAFREYTAPDGMVGDFQNAPQSLNETSDQGARNLFWWPAYAGIAWSGDLGFTTGPFSVDEARTPRGQYFTVWRRQPDGSWKWIWDGGVGPVRDPGPTYASNHLELLPMTSRGIGAEEARRQVDYIERSFRNGTQVATYMSEGAHVYRTGEWRAIGGMRAIGAAALIDTAFYEVRRIEVSEAGDLAFVLGTARWTTREGEERQGQYARMWQHQPEGWRIVFDQLSAQPPG